MTQAAFGQWLQEGGQLVVSKRILEYLEQLNMAPEHLGYLVLAMARCQQGLKSQELAQDPWVKWSLSQGWASWQGEGAQRGITFQPLWKALYRQWEQALPREKEHAPQGGVFDYSKIMKWLDQVRGTLSVTVREKQVLQELNIKYGWSTEFILIFLQLSFERGQNQVNKYLPLARKVYDSGINTVNGLIAFMNSQDWIQHKVAEVKTCVGQYGGVTRPQREIYLKWNNEWRFSHELIMRAAGETVRTNSPSFKYIDGILQNWHENGVATLQEAEKLLVQRGKERNVGVPSTGPKKKSARPDQRDLKTLFGLE